MDTETLELIGLTPNEAKIYRSLLELKKGSIWDIAKHAEIDRRNAYDAIHRLIHKGLAFQVLPKKFLTYAPVHPEKLRELVEEKSVALEKALPRLVKKFNLVSAPQSVYVYKGIGGLKNYIDLEIRTGETIYGLGSKGSWFDPRIKSFATRAAKRFAAAKIKSQVIYDETLRGHPEVIEAISARGEYKFLPKKYAGGSSLEIFGDYVALYSGMETLRLDDDITIFILKDKTLAQDYKKWFDFMWEALPAVKKTKLKS